MKQFNRLLAVLSLSATCAGAWAADFQSGDLYYDILDAEAKTVEVVKPASGKYTLTEVAIPATVENGGTVYNVIAVGANAFSRCSDITSVSLPEGLVELKTDALSYLDKVTELRLPSTLKTIGTRALRSMTGVTELTLPDGLEEVGDNALAYMLSLTSIVFPESVTTLGPGVLASCKSLTNAEILGPVTEIPDKFLEGDMYNSANGLKPIRQFTIPETVTRIGNRAFANTMLESIDIPAAVKSIGKQAFMYCSSLKTVTMHDGLESIAGLAFEQSAVTELNFPGTIKEWGFDYGDYCNTCKNCKYLEKVTFNEGITEIPKNFAYIVPGSGKLTEVYIASTVTKICDGAFYGNSPWREGSKIVFYGTTPPEFNDSNFGSANLFKNCTLYVPADAVDTYSAHAVWGQFANIMPLQRPEAPAEYKNVLGDGNIYATLTLRWADDLAIDNLASAVYPVDTTVGGVLATALSADPRFYALRDAEGNYVAYGFDTNGDNSAAITVAGQALELTDGVATATGDYADAAGSSKYDHWRINGEAGAWRVLLNGEEATLDAEIANGDAVVLEYVPAEGTAAADYTFYLRPADERGLWMLPEMLFDTANGKMQYFPMISNTISNADFYGAGIGVEFTNAATGEASTSMSAYIADAKLGGNSVRLTVSGPEALVARPFFNLRVDGVTTRVYTDTPSSITVNVAHPVTGLRMEGWPEGNIRLYDMFGFRVYAEPADADFATVVYELSDKRAAEVYARSNYEFDHFFAHNTGRYTLTARTSDGAFELKQNFTIIDRDRNGADTETYEDGTFWLSEEWFGHSNGSINYIRPEGDIVFRAYERVNPYEGFGCTSQYATIYGGKMLVMSKQYQDGGDPRTGGGRLTVLDASTMRKLASFNTLDGTDPATTRSSQDGRACVGVNPHKAYIGASGLISVLDLDNLTLDPAGIEGMPAGGSAYSSQYGDMVAAGDYVFVVRQSTGIIIIDAVNDRYHSTIENKNVQGITRTADGNVWYVDYATATRQSKIYCINPATLEIEKEYTLPSAVSCEWGSWRSTKFFAAKRSNKLFWNNNYCWDMDLDETPENVTPIITSDDDRWPLTTNGKKQSIYGSAAYDDRTGEILWSGSQGFGTDGRFTWYNFTDAETGDIRSMRVLPDYYYFPALPLVPDKHRAALNDEAFEIKLAMTQPEGVELDLAEIIDDLDNASAHIRFSLIAETARRAAGDEAEGDEEVTEPEPIAPGEYQATLQGTKLTLVPSKIGTTDVRILAESNGHESTITIPVKIDAEISGIADADTYTGQVSVSGHTVTVGNMAGVEFAVYDIDGRMMTGFVADSDYFTRRLDLAEGVYVLAADNGRRFKVVIR